LVYFFPSSINYYTFPLTLFSQYNSDDSRENAFNNTFGIEYIRRDEEEQEAEGQRKQTKKKKKTKRFETKQKKPHDNTHERKSKDLTFTEQHTERIEKKFTPPQHENIHAETTD
jgi:hypothetical protein